MANLLGGQADILYTAVGLEEAKVLQAQWEQAGAGVVQIAPTNYRHILPQVRADQANPRDLLDVRARKALMHAVDRNQIADGVYPGANLAADGIGWPGTPIGDAVGRGVVRYPYDPARAAALLEELGWRRAGEGPLAKPTGERFQLELRSQGIPEVDTVFALMQQSYSRVGIDLALNNLPGTRNPSDYSLFPGLLITGLPINHARFGGRWHTRQIATAENRYSGLNTNGYSNPELDAVLDRLDRSIRIQDQLREWEAAWRIITDDVAVMSLYYYVQPNAYRKGVIGAMPKIALGSGTWQVHMWDVL
jgi:peptide/nickel transport system substrate-binding protein